MERQYRQGDVLLCAIDAMPSGARPVPNDGDRVVVRRCTGAANRAQRECGGQSVRHTAAH